MATLEERKVELSDLDIDMETILATAKEKNDGVLSEEERVEYDKLDASYDEKYKTYTEDLERENKRNKRKADIATTATVPGPSFQQEPIGSNVTSVTEGFLSDPKHGFETHREMLLAVMQASMTGTLTDKRLLSLQSLAVGSDEGSTVSGPYGNFLLPVGFSPDLMSLDAEGDPTIGRTTQVPMNTQTLEIPARVDKNHTTSVSGGLQVFRRNETDTGTSARMEFEQVKLTATMLFGIAYATEELLEQSPISFIALLDAGFKDEFAAKLLKEKLFGTGVGEYEGVANSACVVEQAIEAGQGTKTILKENIDKMRSRCWRYGNAIWLYNHDCLPQLRSLVQSVGTGGAPVSYFQVGTDGVSTLDGRPAFATEFTKTIGTVGDLVLGNWSQYLEGTLSGPQSAESIHVRFLNHERTFKLWMQNDGKCWWRSPLTPNQSGTTLSPFITLAAR